MKRIIETFIFFVLVFFLIESSQATILEELNLKKLVERSSLIVQGQVKDVSFIKDEGGRIFTIVYVVVEKEFRRGSKKRGALLKVRLLGGEYGGLKQRIAGNPIFNIGEEVFLFLIEEHDFVHLVGMKQGKYTIIEEDGKIYAERDLSGVSLVDKDKGMLRVKTLKTRERIPFEDFISQIRYEVSLMKEVDDEVR